MSEQVGKVKLQTKNTAVTMVIAHTATRFRQHFHPWIIFRERGIEREMDVVAANWC